MDVYKLSSQHVHENKNRNMNSSFKFDTLEELEFDKIIDLSNDDNCSLHPSHYLFMDLCCSYMSSDAFNFSNKESLLFQRTIVYFLSIYPMLKYHHTRVLQYDKLAQLELINGNISEKFISFKGIH